jgi:hypothetical protein
VKITLAFFYPFFFFCPGAYLFALLSPFNFFAWPGGSDFLEDFATEVPLTDLEVVVLQLVTDAVKLSISKARSALESTFFI